MQRPANILILDEPTNHLDVRAKDALKAALAAFSGALILVTHEREFAEGLCNKTFDVK
jgi:ATP-binding cassette subfamily F protein 3